MVLGDGIRRNIATVSPAERALLRDAIVALNHPPFVYPGDRLDTITGGVTYWFKQDEIHARSHVHGCPAFVPWHREMVNRFEALIRKVNPQLSLHYWDWTQDPTAAPDGNGNLVNLFKAGTSGDAFMGNATGSAGDPWLSAGFYNPNANPARTGDEFDPTNNPADPPLDISRSVQPGGAVNPAFDQQCTQASDFPAFDSLINGSHGAAHGHIGETIGNPHTSFRDPFVFFLHSNLDRLFALWQLQIPFVHIRLDPNQLYGTYSSTKGAGDVMSGGPQWGILSPLEPWAGPAAQTDATGIVTNVKHTRPWAAPENEQNLLENRKDSKHSTVVKPSCYDTNPTIIEVVNPGNTIPFNDIPSGETTVRAAHVQFIACFPLTFHVTAGPTAPYAIFNNGTVTVSPSQDIWTDARIWFSFTGGTANTTAPTSQVTIHCDQTNEDFVFTLVANTIARPTVAVMMVLDQSGSMNDPAGKTGLIRIDALREAATHFVELIQPGNAAGIVRFDTVAYPINDPTYPGLAVTTIGNGGVLDPNRSIVRNAVSNSATNVMGSTSIGAGVKLGRNILNSVTGFQEKALLVFTDGLENTSPKIADILSDIDDRTFAIGLGNAQQISTSSLNALTNGTGGNLKITGPLSASTDDYFLLSKFFLQILAGVTNISIVTDPTGFITHGATVIVPFVLNETDIEATVILMTDIPALDFTVQTPAGQIINPGNAQGMQVSFSDAGKTIYYRFRLPVPRGAGARAGTWKALLRLNEVKFKRYCHGGEKGIPPPCRRNGVRYSVSVMAWSNLRMRVNLSQNSLEPGATITLRTTLTEYGLPVENRATVDVNTTNSDGTSVVLHSREIEPGLFETKIIAALPGVYRLHVIAKGVTSRGVPFTREELLTAHAVQGGDNPLPTTPSAGGQELDLCCLLNCLLKEPSVVKFLEVHGLNSDAIRKCIEGCCRSQ